MKEIILLRISGKDKPGVTAFITAILAKEGASILDVGQSVLHENLSLASLPEIRNSMISFIRILCGYFIKLAFVFT